MQGRLEPRIKEHLRKIEVAGLRRHLFAAQGVDLSSNDYLRLSSHPEVKYRMNQESAGMCSCIGEFGLVFRIRSVETSSVAGTTDEGSFFNLEFFTIRRRRSRDWWSWYY